MEYSQFAGADYLMEQPNTSLYVQGQDKGKGLLSIKEEYVLIINNNNNVVPQPLLLSHTHSFICPIYTRHTRF